MKKKASRSLPLPRNFIGQVMRCLGFCQGNPLVERIIALLVAIPLGGLLPYTVYAASHGPVISADGLRWFLAVVVMCGGMAYSFPSVYETMHRIKPSALLAGGATLLFELGMMAQIDPVVTFGCLATLVIMNIIAAMNRLTRTIE